MHKVGYSLYEFDKLINQYVGQDVVLGIYRKTGNTGKFLEVTLPVADANQSYAKSFVLFAGATFQDVTPAICLKLGIPRKGVYMHFANPGTTFWEASRNSSSVTGLKMATVAFINFIPVKNLDDFRLEVSKLKNGDRFVLTVCDYLSYDTSASCKNLELDMGEREELEFYQWDEALMDWRLQ